jgi:hypothetical protein
VPSRPPRAPSKAPPVPSGRPAMAEPLAPPEPVSVNVAPSVPQGPTSAVQSVEPSRAPSAETRLRVSVRASVREPGLLVVRPLAEGEAAPPGTREAVLLMPEALGETDHANGSAR